MRFLDGIGFLQVCMDNIPISSKTEADLLIRVRMVLETLAYANLANAQKCHWQFGLRLSCTIRLGYVDK